MTRGSPATYALHGLLVRSEFPLQGPVVGDLPRRPDFVVIDGGPRDNATPPIGRTLAEVRLPNFRFSATENARRPGHLILHYAAIGDFMIDRYAGTITVLSDTDDGRALVPIILEGSVLAYLLTVDGELTLHASAVEAGGRALALAGGTGAGKSTVAALLCAVGARLVSDDVLRVSVAGGQARCFLGTSMLHLRPAATSIAERIPATSVEETPDGRLGIVPPRPDRTLLPLEAIVIPSLSEEAPGLSVERLRARDALVKLLSYPRHIGWRANGPVRTHFDGVARLAKLVPVYRATIPGPPFHTALGRGLLDAVGMEDR
jgi:hypothetical protein